MCTECRSTEQLPGDFWVSSFDVADCQESLQGWPVIAGLEFWKENAMNSPLKPRVRFCSLLIVAFSHLFSFPVSAQAPPPVSFVARMDFAVGSNPTATVNADFNGDGKLDLVTANQGSNNVSVLLGNGDGTFLPAVNYSVDTGPILVIVGDFNNDGKLDILTGNETGLSGCVICSVSVLLGNGDGTFQPQQLTTISSQLPSVLVGDFNGDGNLDLAFATAVPQLGNSAIAVMFGNGDGTFQPQSMGYAGPFPTPGVIESADLNGDGKPDVVVTIVSPAAVSVFLGNGDGTFQQPKTTTVNPNVGISSFAIADFTGDGKLDLAFVGGSNSFVVVGNGDGTFQPNMIESDGGVYQRSGVPIAGDFNGDGILDLVSPAFGGSLAALDLGKGGGEFESAIYIPGFSTVGNVAVGDFNRDGKLDLAAGVTGYDNLVGVVLGNGDGTFQTDTSVNVTSGLLAANNFVLSADFNGDQKTDLLAMLDFLQVTGEFGVLLGNGNGTFQNQIITNAGGSCAGNPGNEPDCMAATGDLNGDGKADVVVTLDPAGSVGVFLGNGDGTFKTEMDYGGGGTSIALADFNGDGYLDIVTTGDTNNNIAIQLGNGDGTFQFPTTVPTNGPAKFVVTGDFNGDGKIDLAIATGTDVAIFLGNGNGTFGTETDYSVPDCLWLVAADLNGDGKIDLATANGAPANNASVLLGNGDGSFQAPTNYSTTNPPTSIISGDFNQDGKVDLAVCNGPDVSIFLGNGDGTFQPDIKFGTQGTGQLTSADLNGDGSPDIAVSGISLLFNRKGLASGAQLVPASLTFSSQNVGTTSAAQAITLTNTGNTSLSITAITAAGIDNADFAQTNTCGASLAAGSNCKINVTFTPLASGTRSGSISITDSSAGSPQIIPLSGVGLASGLGLQVSGSDSATIAAGGTATYMLSIGGNGVGGTATLSCTGAPSGATCSFPGGSTTTVSATTPSGFDVSVTTKGTVGADNSSKNLPYQFVFASVVLGLMLTPAGQRRRPLARRLAMFLPLAVLFLVVGCGRGGNSGGNSGGTPAGSYTLTVTASISSSTASVPLKLIVQ